MHKYLLAAAAAAAIATPAAARDGSSYVGIEGGVLLPRDSDFDVRFTDGTTTVDYDDGFRIDYKPGVDLDLIGGYDFGMIRAEAELGYKRTKMDEVRLSNELRADLEDELGGPITDEDLDLGGERLSVLSLMGNALLDFGGNRGFGAYVGGGLGRARVKAFDETDGAWAWQLLAGVRTALSDNIDAGVKYRYFNTRRLNFGDDFDVDGEAFGIGADGKFRSHSLLAGLTFNFGGRAAPLPQPPPPPPPPPPPRPPATKTCPDGSVVLVTEYCPVPPPPPPPPLPLPERG